MRINIVTERHNGTGLEKPSSFALRLHYDIFYGLHSSQHVREKRNISGGELSIHRFHRYHSYSLGKKRKRITKTYTLE